MAMTVFLSPTPSPLSLTASGKDDVVGRLPAKTRLVCQAANQAAGTNKWSINQHLLTAFSDDNLSVAHEQKVREMKGVIITSAKDPLQGLMLVDAIQRLGIDFHFQDEIEAILERQLVEMNLRNNQECQTLFEVSLRFRLLRQEGHHVTAEVFNPFMDKREGRFKEDLRHDIKGLMELHESAHLNIGGEHNLYEAFSFTQKHLNHSLDYLEKAQALKVENTLKHPYNKSISKFMAKIFTKDFDGGMYRWIKPMQELADMEFMMANCMHSKELFEVSRWWDDVRLSKKLELARDQPLKWYTWSMAILTSPTLTDLRIDLTKAISFIYIIDDIFDIYGSVDQLTLFAEAVKRWEFAEVEMLPDYMNVCLKALYEVTNEIAYTIHKKYGNDPIHSLRESWAKLCDAFLEEAKWFASKEVPKADEYLRVATTSSGVHVVLVHIFFLLGLDDAKPGSAIGLHDVADITSSVARILRLWDDLGSAKDENQDGHDGSYIDCYVQEHGVTVEFAKQQMIDMISSEWERLSRENLRINKLSPSFTKASLNLARMVPLMYTYDGDQNLPLLEGHLRNLLT